MALKRNSQEEQNRLSLLFHAYDVDNSGRIEKSEFSAICRDLCVPSQEAEGIFNRLDTDKDGTVTLEELLDGFTERHKKNTDDDGDKEEDENLPAVEEFSITKEQVISRWDMKSSTYHHLSLVLYGMLGDILFQAEMVEVHVTEY